jgi:hypothetical protein
VDSAANREAFGALDLTTAIRDVDDRNGNASAIGKHDKTGKCRRLAIISINPSRDTHKRALRQSVASQERPGC